MRLYRLALALLVALLALGVAVAVLLSALGGSRVRRWAERKAEAALDLPVAIGGRIAPSLSLTPAISVGDLRIGSAPGVPEPPLAEFGELVVHLDLGHLLAKREIRVARLGVRDGRLTLPTRGESSEPGISDSELAALLERLPDATRIRDVELEIGRPDGEPLALVLEDARLGRCGDPLALRGDLQGVPLSLAATLGCSGAVALAVEDLELTLGGSEVRGELAIGLGPPRPRIAGELRASRFAAADLAAADLGTQGADVVGDELLDAPIPFDVLEVIDLEVGFAWERLVLDALTLEHVRGRIELTAGRLQLVVEEAVLWEGALAARVDADGRAAPPALSVTASADDLSVAALEGVEASGSFDVEVDLSARGDTSRALLAGLGGTAWIALESTDFGEQPLTLLGRDMFQILYSRLQQEQRGLLNCGVILMEFEQGSGRAGVLLDTPGATLGGTGVLDLAELEAEFLLRPAPKKASVGALKTPIRIAGPLTDLRAGLDRKGAAADASYVLLLGVVNPVLAVAPLIDLGTGEGNACETALASASPEAFERKGQFGQTKDRAAGAVEWLRGLAAPAPSAESGGAAPDAAEPAP